MLTPILIAAPIAGTLEIPFALVVLGAAICDAQREAIWQ